MAETKTESKITAPRLLAFIGSNGYLEIALRGGSVSGFINAEVGDEVKVRRQPGDNR